LRDRALILLGFAGAFRVSELVGIDVEDIRRAREGISAQLGRTKTDQEARGALVPIPKGQHLRPVAALDGWLAAADITSGAVFRAIGKGDKLKAMRLSKRGAQEIIPARFAAAGYEGYSAHSLRAGFLTSAMEYGADIFRAADQGGSASWRQCGSTTVERSCSAITRAAGSSKGNTPPLRLWPACCFGEAETTRDGNPLSPLLHKTPKKGRNTPLLPRLRDKGRQNKASCRARRCLEVLDRLGRGSRPYWSTRLPG
jgi:hypothetical protein